MIENIEYSVTESGLQVGVPKDLADRLFEGNHLGNDLEIVRYASVPAKKRVVEMIDTDDGYTVNLNFKKVRNLRAGQDRGNALHQLTRTHRQLVESASGNQRSQIVEVGYSEGPVRAGVFGMAALVHWQPEDQANLARLQASVEEDMQAAANLLLPMTEEDVANNVQAQFSNNHAALIINHQGLSGMFSSSEYDPSESFFTLSSRNVWNDAQQLVCLTGLASIAKTRE